VAYTLADAVFVRCGSTHPWSRVVVEKPFGEDRESSDRLGHELAKVFVEEQTYRIDHYLGKEVVQNLMVLRFANLIFEPIWSAKFIRNVQVTWKEDIGVEGRGGYFDGYGIIRDVMQNHLIQILSLIAMEPPSRLDANCIRDEKVKALRAVAPLKLEDLVVGQYTGGERDGRRCPAYVEEKGVPAGSLTPTYAAAVFRLNNSRWADVPFFIRAGKALDEKQTEIRIQFRKVPGNMFCQIGGCSAANELSIRVQPDEAIHFTVVNKVPGLELKLAPRDLDLHYKAVFSESIPDAYESLLLDVVTGDKSLFIRKDELAAAWDIFTPVLHEMRNRGQKPEPYACFSQGPSAAGVLARHIGIGAD
jgi:glucose-6-phosphate 1-dehydrogenase